MKLYRNVIILVIALALVTGTYFIIKSLNVKEDTAKIPVTKLMDVLIDDIIQLQIDNPDGSFIFDRVQGSKTAEWTVVLPLDLDIDTSKVNSLAINIAGVVADKEIGPAEGKTLSDYGFGTPTTVVIRTKDGKVKTFLLGSKAPSGDSYYFMEKGGETIYTIDTYTAGKMLITRLNLKKTALFTNVADDILGVSMERGGKNLFTVSKLGELWQMTAPISANANNAEVDGILSTILALNAKEFVEENPADLGKYGLDTPAYAFGLETATSKINLLLGKQDKNTGIIYAKFADRKDVFTLYTNTFTFLDKPLREIFECFVYLVNINDVDKIVIDIDGKTIESVLKTDEENSDNDKFTVDGKDASMKDSSGFAVYRSFYESLIGITLSELELDAVPAGEPDVTFTYYLQKDPGVMKVEFIPKDENYSYAMRNGVYTGMVVERKAFDSKTGVLAAYKTLMDFLAASE